MITVAVCIVNYNTCDLLRECLGSVIAQNPDEIVVVDSASTDQSVQMMKSEFPTIPLLALDENIGYGAASNRATAICQSTYIILLNADTRMKPGSLKALSTYLSDHPQVAIVGPRILNPDGTLQTSCFHFPTPLHIFLYVSGLYRSIPGIPILKQRTLQKMTSEAARPVPWILGAALAFRREIVDGLGGFDEDFFMYFEEVDLCYRLFSEGKQTHFVPEAEIIHVSGGSTTQKRAWSSIQYFASLAQFYRKHYSSFKLTAMVLSVKSVAIFKMARDLLVLQITRDETRRSTIEENLEIHRALLFGDWHRRPAIAIPVHA